MVGRIRYYQPNWAMTVEGSSVLVQFHSAAHAQGSRGEGVQYGFNATYESLPFDSCPLLYPRL